MTTELYWMTATVLMTALFWVPYILDRLVVRGIWGAVSGLQPETGEPHSLWARRAMRAHGNAVENLAIFVPAVLTAHVLSISTAVTQMAVVVYFFARLTHFIVHTMGIPLVRTLSFFIGWSAQIVILATILGWF